MSTDEQQRRGGFVPIGELAGTLPGLVPRELAMTTQARHHFTTLQQVNQLVEASEGGRRPGLYGAAARAVFVAAHQPKATDAVRPAQRSVRLW